MYWNFHGHDNFETVLGVLLLIALAAAVLAALLTAQPPMLITVPAMTI
ncbi:MAG: hypothetical protein VW405_10210 [Rhodospirillaceae bacterium]